MFMNWRDGEQGFSDNCPGTMNPCIFSIWCAEKYVSQRFDKGRHRDMTDRTSSGNRNTDPMPEGIHEHIIFAAPCFGKKDTLRGASYGMMLITPDRLIITPLPSGHIHPDMTGTEGDAYSEKQVTPPGFCPHPEFFLAGIHGVSRPWIPGQEGRPDPS